MKETNRVIELRDGKDFWSGYDRETEMRDRSASRSGRRARRRRSPLAPVAHIVGWAAAIVLLFSAVYGWWKIVPDSDAAAYPVRSVAEAGEQYGKEGMSEETSAVPAGVDSTPWNLMLVNRDHPIPDGYEMELVDVPGGEKVDQRIYEPLMEMLDAAAAEELGPIVVSGFRTQEKQQSLYDEKIQKYQNQGYSKEEAVELAEQWVARPGTSEHQLGLAVDINGATYDIYLWLQANSYKYGFIFRYPGSKAEITGVAEEVWHYRYVGTEAALEIYEQGVCLEEYTEGSQIKIPVETAQNEDAWYRDGDTWRRGAPGTGSGQE